MTRSRFSTSARRAFTVVELLVVIGILLVLVTITVGVGALVRQGGTQRVTQSVLTTLDRALDEYIAITGAIPPYTPNLHIGVPGQNAQLAGPYQGAEHPRRPDAAVFLQLTDGTGKVLEIVGNLPGRFLYATPSPSAGVSVNVNGADVSPEVPSIVDGWADDAWSNPWNLEQQQVIYFVHPENALAQDLYGQCVSNRPYFLSAGADRLYGLNDDVLIPVPSDGSPFDGSTHTYASVLEAQRDNLTSYPIEPISQAAFDRTDAQGVR